MHSPVLTEVSAHGEPEQGDADRSSDPRPRSRACSPTAARWPSSASPSTTAARTRRPANGKTSRSSSTCEAFNRGENGKQADLVEQYLRKGHQVFIEGHLKLDQWTTQDGAEALATQDRRRQLPVPRAARRGRAARGGGLRRRRAAPSAGRERPTAHDDGPADADDGPAGDPPAAAAAADDEFRFELDSRHEVRHDRIR